MLDEHLVYERVGLDGFTRLTRAFYQQVTTDDILGPMYPADDMEGAEQRLRDFLVYRFGGPQDYIEQRGHPRLRMRHAPFPIDVAAAERWFELMQRALAAAALAEDATEVLTQFFRQMTLFLVNRAPS